MKGKYKIILGTIIFLIIIVLIVLVLPKSKLDHIDTDEPKVEIKVLENIEQYGYHLNERDSKLMRNTYEELKTVLSSDQVDYDEYAKIIAKMFVIDLWTMNNKTNRYDVGSVDYVYPDSVNNFKLNVENTIYKMIENNVNGSRKQELPAVKSIISEELTKGKFKVNDSDIDSFIVNIEWNYDKDLGYETKASITLVKVDDKLYVVEYVAGE